MYMDKLRQAVEILKEKKIDMWLIFARETKMIPEPSLDLIAGVSCVGQAVFVVTQNGESTAIVANLDVEEIKRFSPFKEVIGYKKSLTDILLNKIENFRPEKIAVNFSKDSPAADGLTYGMYLNLCDYLKGTPYVERLVSSEDIISALRGRKIGKEIEKIRKSVDITLDLIDIFNRKLRPGISEIQAADILKGEMKKRDLEPAWDEKFCPSVFTGPQEYGTHSGPTGKTIEKGHVFNIDFGIRLDGYCSDLQRTWYFLNDGETDAPGEVKKAFDSIKSAIQESAKAIKPGVEGWVVDKTARDCLKADGFEDFPHALGHQVGRAAHDGGGLLCPKWDKYGNLPYLKIEENQVYTIEPRINLPEYGVVTVEEMVHVKENGAEFISVPQKELYLK